MFDLDQAIADWRRQMLAAGIKTPVPLDELEVHLRDDIEQQMRSGLNAQQAFETASQRIGQASTLESEFGKIVEAKEALQRKLMGVFCVVFPISYSLWSAYLLLKVEMSLAEQILGFVAVALTALSICSWPYIHRFLPIVRNQRIRMAVQVSCVLLWIVCGAFFMKFILPQFDLTRGQSAVAVLWLAAPVAVLTGLAYGLGLAARSESVKADS